MAHRNTVTAILLAVATTAGITLGQLSGQPTEEEQKPQGTTPLRIMPYVDIKAVSDSNIDRTTTDENDEVYGQALAGLKIGYSGSSLNLLLTAFASTRAHADESDRDFDTVGQGLHLRYGTRDTILIEASQAYRQVTDTDSFGTDVAVGGVSPDSVLDVASRQERDILQAGLSIGFAPGDKSEIDVGYRFDSVDYNDSGLLKLTSHSATLEVANELTDKTAALVAVRGGIQDSDAIDDSADLYAASLGFRISGTDKLNLRATGGFQQYNRPDSDESIDSFVYNVLATLATTDKVTMNAGARNGTQLSSLFAGNGTEYMIFWLGAALQASSAVRLSVNAAYREDEYLDPILVGDALVDRTDKGTGVRLRADYQAPSDYLSLYSQVLFETVESNAADYDQTLISIGMRLQY